MPTHSDYVNFLSTYELSEEDVAPAFKIGDYSPAWTINEKYGGDKAPRTGDAELDYLLDVFCSNTNDLLQSLAKSLWRCLPPESRDGNTKGVGPARFNIYNGVFPTNEINAQCTPYTDGYLVLLDHGIIELIEATVTLLFAIGFGQERRDEIIVEAARNLVTTGQLPNLLELGVDAKIPGGRDDVISLISRTQQFAIAHEWGHIAQGHLDGSNMMAMDTRVGTLEVFSKSEGQEFEADAWAMLALSGLGSDRHEKGLSVAGCFSFLAVAELVNRLRTQLEPSYSSTHPSAARRVGSIHKLLLESGYLATTDDLFYSTVLAEFAFLFRQQFDDPWLPSPL